MEKYSKGDVSAIVSRNTEHLTERDSCLNTSQKNTVLTEKIESTGNNRVKCKKSDSIRSLTRAGKKRELTKFEPEELDKYCRKSDSFSTVKRAKYEHEESNLLNSNISNKSSCDGEKQRQISKSKIQTCSLDMYQYDFIQKESNNSYETVNAEFSDTKNLKTPKSHKKRKKIPDNCVDKNKFTIFVGNLPLSYDHKKVVKLFSRFGEVENARIRCVPVANANIKKKTSAITKTFHPNRNSAVAFVVFKSIDSVARAISENGMLLNGHHLRIDSCAAQEKNPKKSVFVGGLPFDIEDDDLWNFFKKCGEIEDVRVIRDGKVSMGKGFGYVNFKSSASVELALKLSGEILKDRKINVERCIYRKNKKIPKNNYVYEHNRNKSKDKVEYEKDMKNLGKTCGPNEFQGKRAAQKRTKKKRGLTKNAVRKNQIKSAFLSTSKKC